MNPKLAFRYILKLEWLAIFRYFDIKFAFPWKFSKKKNIPNLDTLSFLRKDQLFFSSFWDKSPGPHVVVQASFKFLYSWGLSGWPWIQDPLASFCGNLWLQTCIPWLALCGARNLIQGFLMVGKYSINWARSPALVCSLRNIVVTVKKIILFNYKVWMSTLSILNYNKQGNM